MNQVILTDEKGSKQGTADILEAHTGKGKLHKAFSIFIFRNKGKEMLIQKRSSQKMLWPLIWANTCCSHPREEENILQAGERRLKEECGFTCPLKEHSCFVYRAKDPHGRGVEYEHDTILVGDIDKNTEVSPDPTEIAQVKWIKLKRLKKEMRKHPDEYAPWFHEALSRIQESDD